MGVLIRTRGAAAPRRKSSFRSEARIDSFMSTEIVAVDADADVHEAYRILGAHGVRRLPVVSGDDIVGMLTVDDLIVGIATDLDRLVQPVVGELIFGHHPAPMPVVRAGVQLSSREELESSLGRRPARSG